MSSRHPVKERRKLHKDNVHLLHQENMRWPKELVEIPKEHWAKLEEGKQESRIAVWRSKNMLVQIFDQEGHVRLSVCRTCLNAVGDYQDGIEWDTMQAVKSAVGYAGYWACELFPPDDEVVNVANIRHMFILNDIPEFAWRKKHADSEEERQS